ncbi:MAG: PAAR-like domain-containing protein [Xanthomonadales bacterium]|jgi:hypothetical protein|nr:PAAR-like domain-containing protein [Xanthomonadales bacterium]
MPTDVFANSREIASQASSGEATAFPDVCQTPSAPSPAGPVPIPYPNVGMAGKLKQANKIDGKVLVGNKAAKELQSKAIDSLGKNSGLKADSATAAVLMGASVYKKSTGNEAGTAATKGIASSKTTGPAASHASQAPNVKIYGKHVDLYPR